jgi:hypothetical protein
MQETKIRTPAKDRPPPRSGWIRLVAMLGVGALLIGTLYGVWQAVASSDDPGQTVPREPDFSLTDEQALDRFEQLVALSYAAINDRDQSRLAQIFTIDSPTKDRSANVITELQKDQVTDESSYRTVSLQVLDNTPQEIRVLQRVQTRPCFRSDSGKDVTTGRAEIEYDIEWTMRLSDSRWLLHESQARNDEVTDESPASC